MCVHVCVRNATKMKADLETIMASE